jgi:hypothetical protein
MITREGIREIRTGVDDDIGGNRDFRCDRVLYARQKDWQKKRPSESILAIEISFQRYFLSVRTFQNFGTLSPVLLSTGSPF